MLGRRERQRTFSLGERRKRWFVVVVRGIRHHGIPVIVALFSKVDNTRGRHGDPSQATDAHLGFDFGLSAVAFSTYIWGQQEHFGILWCGVGSPKFFFCDRVIFKVDRSNVNFDVFFEVRKSAAKGTQECRVVRLEQRPNTLVMEGVRARCDEKCLSNCYRK
jgi:hypothetical protein